MYFGEIEWNVKKNIKLFDMWEECENKCYFYFLILNKGFKVCMLEILKFWWWCGFDMYGREMDWCCFRNLKLIFCKNIKKKIFDFFLCFKWNGF